MRKALLLVCLVACGEKPLLSRPLPDLIASPSRAGISVAALKYAPNERLRWEVHHKGFSIGKVELIASGDHITSRFRTSQFASMFAKAEHELTTTLSNTAYPDAANEIAEVNGEHERYEIVFDRGTFVINGKPRRIPDGAVHTVHTLHTALGVIRAWAVPKAKPGFLMVLHAGELYRLSLDTPIAEDWRGTATLKVEGRILAEDDKTVKPILFTMWLTANDARVPIRVNVSSDGKQLDAEAIDD